MKHILFAILACLSAFTYAQGTSVTYAVNDQEYEGYFISAGDQAPVVLLLHDWDGLTDYEVKRAQMLFEEGYSVFAADLFGKGVRPTEVKDKRQHTGELYKDRSKMRALMEGAITQAKAMGANTDNAVVAGYCFGGAAALELARSGASVKGFATFHGGLSTPEGQNYSEVSAPVLVMHGTADTAIPMTQFADLAARFESEKVDHEMVTYGGAPHAFTVFGSERYRQAADEKSWALFKEFLASNTK